MGIIIKENFQILLDLDGVLCDCYWKKCPHDEIDQEQVFKPKSIKALNRIIKYYDADLIMISGWNSKFMDEDHYSKFLSNRGVIINNPVVIGDQHNRVNYIESLINDNIIDKYLIIDDEPHGYFRNSIIIEYKRILAPNRYRCLDNFDVLHVTKNWKLNV